MENEPLLVGKYSNEIIVLFLSQFYAFVGEGKLCNNLCITKHKELLLDAHLNNIKVQVHLRNVN